ncbi:MAG: hypothetical protein LUE89_05590 [Clostridiales bacterium]|nr:hypothetical protein [Clostridiales bacterium]
MSISDKLSDVVSGIVKPTSIAQMLSDSFEVTASIPEPISATLGSFNAINTTCEVNYRPAVEQSAVCTP